MAKPRLQTFSNKVVGSKLGASASPKKPNPLMPRKDYSKNQKKHPELISNANFGDTGLTGES